MVQPVFLKLLLTQQAINEACMFKCGRDMAVCVNRNGGTLQKCEDEETSLSVYSESSKSSLRIQWRGPFTQSLKWSGGQEVAQ